MTAPIGTDEAAALARQHYGLVGTVRPLPGYADQNFRLDTATAAVVLKFAAPGSDPVQIEFESAVLRAADSPLCPELLPNASGDQLSLVVTAEGPRWLRVMSLRPGTPLAGCRPFEPALLADLGRRLAAIDRNLLAFEQPGMDRPLDWDLRRAADLCDGVRELGDPAVRAAVEHFAVQFLAQVTPRFDGLRRSVIHNDANDYNLLVADGALSGILDFGDAIRTCTVFEPAIAGAYLVLDAADPLAVLAAFVAGYHGVLPLVDPEFEVLFPALCMRLGVSAVLAERAAAARPGDDYLTISQAPVHRTLVDLHRRWQAGGLEPRAVADRLRVACGVAVPERAGRPPAALAAARRRHLGPSLSLAYQSPLHIVGGRGAYLFDATGRGYVDGVNNVCHVGHGHPRVVAAAHRQMARLNTNTRYLHDHLVAYAERLTALFPAPLDTCFLVCSGSEANELAVRLARTWTGRRGMVVLDGAYHGNTSTLIDLSPYKHAGPGGQGRPDWVEVAELPDGYRGRLRYGEADLGPRYAAAVAAALERTGAHGGAAALLVESMAGCGGQVEYPAGYLRAAYDHARAAGALCIADEVQVGFGRVGSHWWAFETQDVVPDIVTLGKPIGNGHPLAAVVTRADIAAAFANGMEYFNTFGGNPVSCAVGLAVLDAIEADGLRPHAAAVGQFLRDGLQALQARFPLLGDVRGRGLFLGVELVRDPQSREPAAAELTALVEGLKDAGFLLGTDGAQRNVLKLKPPLPFGRADSELLLVALERLLGELSAGQPVAGACVLPGPDR